MSEEETQALIPEVVHDEREGLTPTQLAKVYDQYLNSDLTIRELSMDSGIPYSQLLALAKKHKWVERKKAIQQELFQAAEDKYRKFISENKVPTATRHLEAATKIEEKVQKVAEKIDVESPKASIELARVAKALADSSNVSARAAGLNTTPEYNGEGKSAGGRQPLVIIGLKAEKVSVTSSAQGEPV